MPALRQMRCSGRCIARETGIHTFASCVSARIANVETCLSVLRHDINPFLTYLTNKKMSEALELVVSPVNIKTRVRADPTISVEHLAALLVA